MMSNIFPLVLNVSCMPMLQSWNGYVRTAAKYMENIVGAGISPCFTPLSIEIQSDRDPLKVTRAFMLRCSSLNILPNAGGHPIFPIIFHKASQLTVSNALVRSTKTWYNGACCSMRFSCSCLVDKIMSVVPLPERKPHCVSGMTNGYTSFIRRFKNSLASTLPTTARSVIPWWLSHSDLIPFH